MNYDNLIKWTNRYSDTMEDDDKGRWARVAYSGSTDSSGFPFKDSKVTMFQIAWINKLLIDNKIKFLISFSYPHSGKSVFDKIEDAQNEVENTFRFFIECVTSTTSELTSNTLNH